MVATLNSEWCRVNRSVRGGDRKMGDSDELMWDHRSAGNTETTIERAISTMMIHSNSSMRLTPARSVIFP